MRASLQGGDPYERLRFDVLLDVLRPAVLPRPDERLAAAARMLSIRLGYRRRARFAARRALDFSAEVRWVCRLRLGAGFFHGAFRLADRVVDLAM
jgi:hypothetical protein